MWGWMYAVRLPAVAAMKMKFDPTLPSGVQMAQLPAKVRWKADNYNHLMEQPTLFYATVLSLCVLGEYPAFTVYMAWSYMVLRVLHSLLQALTNTVEVRFVLYMLSNIPLLVLIAIAANAVFFDTVGG